MPPTVGGGLLDADRWWTMARMPATWRADDHQPEAAIALVSLATIGMTGIVVRSDGAVFEKYYRGIDPLLVIALVSIVGAVCLGALQSRDWFSALSQRTTLRSVVRSAAPAVLFAMVAVAADVIIRFPEDMNVAPPQSLLFYPTIAYVAEVVFHLLPLAVLAVGLGPASDGRPRDRRVLLLSVLATALLEPTFQLLSGEAPLSLSGSFVWLHVFAFNVVQLRVLRRHDFVSMYAFRIAYYLCWHVVWGVVRLRVLFA